MFFKKPMCHSASPNAVGREATAVMVNTRGSVTVEITAESSPPLD